MSDSDFQKWYEDNKDDFNEARRQRYENDPEYREQVKRWNAEARERRRRERLEDRKKQRELVRVVSERSWKVEYVEGVGDVHTLGALAAMTGKSLSTLRLWERKGVLPETPYRDASGGRLYSTEQIDEIVADLKERGLVQEIKVKRPPKPLEAIHKVRWVDGKEEWTKLYRVSMVADVLERSVSTISRLERQNHIPATTLRTVKRGQRRYTYEQINAMADVWHDMGYSCRGKRWKEFHDRVAKKWNEQGVMGAEIVE